MLHSNFSCCIMHAECAHVDCRLFWRHARPCAPHPSPICCRYLKALPKAAHFLCTPDAAAVALWQLLPEETPKNEVRPEAIRSGIVPLALISHLVAC